MTAGAVAVVLAAGLAAGLGVAVELGAVLSERVARDACGTGLSPQPATAATTPSTTARASALRGAVPAPVIPEDADVVTT